MWPRWNDLFGKFVCQTGIGYTSPGGNDANHFEPLSRKDYEVPIVLAGLVVVCVLHFVTAWTWRAWAFWVKIILAIQVCAIAITGAVIAIAIQRTPIENYVQTLPVTLQLLPLTAAMKPMDSNKPQRFDVDGFQIEWTYLNDVCSFFAVRPNSAKMCGVCPVIASNGPLVLRRDSKHDLWFFDGAYQNWPTPTRSQLAFRGTDSACVHPRDADIADVIRPTRARLALSLSGVLGLLILVSLPIKRTRDVAYRLCATFLAILPIVPWLVALL
jgi:hypothetical protein